MSTKAQAILDEIRALAPQDRFEVLRELQQPGVTAADQRVSRQKAIRHGRGMFAGSGLLEALLADRVKERGIP